MIIGTAGHVDHGKSALVKALTGVDADRLAEEKRRGITIELGYAYTGRLGFIDVPGHERFVHTMLAGASLVVTGTLVAGTIRVGDRLMLSPSGLELRVRGLHAQNRPAEVAEAGERVALNIVGPRLSKEAVPRGDWVLHPEIHAPTA